VTHHNYCVNLRRRTGNTSRLLWQSLCECVQAQDPPARPQGVEELLHLLAAQQVASRTEEGEEGEPDAQQQADHQAYTQSEHTLLGLSVSVWVNECIL